MAECASRVGRRRLRAEDVAWSSPTHNMQYDVPVTTDVDQISQASQRFSFHVGKVGYVAESDLAETLGQREVLPHPQRPLAELGERDCRRYGVV